MATFGVCAPIRQNRCIPSPISKLDSVLEPWHEGVSDDVAFATGFTDAGIPLCVEPSSVAEPRDGEPFDCFQNFIVGGGCLEPDVRTF